MTGGPAPPSSGTPPDLMIANLEPIASKPETSTYRLKVVLRGTKPPIWRRLQVPGNATLGWLHAVLQVAMGWTNSHLHHFFVGAVRYRNRRSSEDVALGGEADRDENRALLARVVPELGAQFVYEYDFGDSWLHLITVEDVLRPAPGAKPTALCLDGARACPPRGLRRRLGLRGPAQDPQESETQAAPRDDRMAWRPVRSCRL